MDFKTCIEEGRKAVGEGRIADARVWFERAAGLNPEDWEAKLQFALSALLCGDRRTFEGVFDSRENPPPESSPRVQRLWRTALHFAGSMAAAASIAATVPACSTSSRDSGTTAASGSDAKPVATEPAGKTAEPAGKTTEPPSPPADAMAPMEEEVYSAHRYSAGIRPPVFDDAKPSMDATPVMKPDDMRPPATKYGLAPRTGEFE